MNTNGRSTRVLPTDLSQEFEITLARAFEVPTEGIKTVAIVGTVDWLTVTAKSKEARRELYNLTMAHIADAAHTGMKSQNWKFKGYNGLKVDGYRWGTRADSDICMLSANDANELWSPLLKHAENVTRVDLAVTVETQKPIADLASLYYAWEEETYMLNLHPKKRIRCSLIQNNSQGQTLYVGSRVSDQMGRIYDKAAEQQMPEFIGRLWRYEVEFKRDRANAIAHSLCQAKSLDKSVGENIRSTVFLWFTARDFPPIFDSQGDELSLEIEARVTSDEISLKWLSSQVKPTVQRLIEAGKIDDVGEALEVKLAKVTDLV